MSAPKPTKRKKPEPHVCPITAEDMVKAHNTGYTAGHADGKTEAAVDRVAVIRECLHVLDARRKVLKSQWFKGTQLNELDAIEAEVMKLLPR